jgi:menaquinone-9 beta-reductase
LSITHGNNNNNAASVAGNSVIIVGSGPAGASVAYHLANAGFNVTVLDQSIFPREKICGDFVSPGSIEELQKIGVTNLPAFERGHRIVQATIYVSGKELVAGTFPDIGLPRFSRVLKRKVLDNLILQAAEKAGAKFYGGFNVVDCTFGIEGVTVKAVGPKGTKTFRADLLIGADGNNSLIARQIRGSAWPVENSAIVANAYFEGVSGNPDEANVFYSNESFPGYSWLFPTGKDEANVGVGLVLGANPPAENPKDLLNKFVANDAGMRSRLEHAKIKGQIEVASLNLHDPQMSIVADGVMLVGEAAGLVNPYNGEGVQFALKSGRWAAETVIAVKGDYSKNALSAYSKRVEDELGYGFKVSEFLLKLLRNRHLNYAWLRWIELMGEKSKVDPQYAALTSGILSGMIFPDQEQANEALIGTFQEVTLSLGIKSLSAALSEPLSMPQAAVSLAQASFEAAKYAMNDPFDALRWGLDAAARVMEVSSKAAEKTFSTATRVQSKEKESGENDA